ncbi:MAG TPA: holo-ACP synthase [Acidobacteriaceae bacterium]|jgi:holo-[acyl-carrier protein] synthase|nr:holo-ACP synthase [Acidobacteriaceae bacterium]
MLVGTGTDIIEIARIQRSIQRYGQRFTRRVFTPGEIAYCEGKKNAAESYAGRFAAKEAAAKALGTGIAQGVTWLEIEVRRQPGERPSVHFTGRAATRAAAMNVAAASLSITHSRELALATVLLESMESQESK